jgi:hypothetical protein
MSDRRNHDADAVEFPAPRLADVHAPFRHALAEVQRIELAISDLSYGGPLDINDPQERADAYRSRRDAVERLKSDLSAAKQALTDERAKGSVKVVRIVRPQIEALDAAVADRARELLAAFDARERALTPLSRDGVHVSMLAGVGLPPYAAEPVRTWLRSFDKGKGKQ